MVASLPRYLFSRKQKCRKSMPFNQYIPICIQYPSNFSKHVLMPIQTACLAFRKYMQLTYDNRMYIAATCLRLDHLSASIGMDRSMRPRTCTRLAYIRPSAKFLER